MQRTTNAGAAATQKRNGHDYCTRPATDATRMIVPSWLPIAAQRGTCTTPADQPWANDLAGASLCGSPRLSVLTRAGLDPRMVWPLFSAGDFSRRHQYGAQLSGAGIIVAPR